MPTTFEKITQRVVDRCTGGDPAVAPNTFVRDPAQPGFAIWIGKTKSTFIVEGRAGRGGDPVRYRLGTVGRLDLDEALTQAKEEVAKLARGVNPAATLRKKKGVALTLRQALDLVRLRDIKASTIADYERSLIALGWMDRRLKSISGDELLALYAKRKGKNTSTGRMMRSFRSCWNAARTEHPTLPPCPTAALKDKVKKWSSAPRRRRVVDDASLPLWRKQVDALQHEGVRDLLLFLHYTGCRIGESRALKAADVNLQAGQFTLLAPKNSRPVDLPVTTQVRAILARRVKAGGDSLFPQYDVRRIHASVSATPWSYHDLRRGYITVAHRIGVDNEISRALTNHAIGDVHGGYVTMTPDTLRPDAQRIADHLDRLARIRGANVLPLRRRA